MNEYNFDVLNDKDFEILCKDLLEVDLNIKLQSFKSGRDQGIDLRCAYGENKNLIVQAKHYLKSKFSQLKHKLQKEELPKVEILNPSKYIVVTSMELNPREVGEIYSMFSDYMDSVHDVYYRQTLNSLLRKNPDIEKRFYKLWLSSSTMLTTILNNAIIGRSRFLVNDILNEYKLYVHSVSHQNLIKKLLDEKVVIITGAPGIGKTTLAKMLLYTVMGSGEFEVIEAAENIENIESVIDFTGNKRQIVFFDDFLGANLLELFRPVNGANYVVNFIRRIQALPEKYLIMTSRTTILNQAMSRFEQVKWINRNRVLEYVIEVKDYSRYEKAKILYNHLYFKRVSLDYRQAFIDNKFYLEIIDHPNYNPRLIEFITTDKLSKFENQRQVRDDILRVLENPSEIWEDHYINNLGVPEKYILQSLFGHGGNISISKLEDTYNRRLQISNEEIPDKELNSFSRGLRTLLGGFCNSIIPKDSDENTISFSNPSVGDFLISYLNRNSRLVLEIVMSLSSYLEVVSLKNKLFIQLGIEQQYILKEYLSKDVYSVLSSEKWQPSYDKVLYISYNYLSEENQKSLLSHTFDEKVSYASNFDHFPACWSALFIMSKVEKSRKYVLENFDELIEALYYAARNSQEFGKSREIFEVYNVNFYEWYHNLDGEDLINYRISQILSEEISQQLFDNYDDLDYYVEKEFVIGYDYETDVIEKFKLETDLDSIAIDYLNDIINDHGIFQDDDDASIELDIRFEELKDEIEIEKNKNVYTSEMSYDEYKDRLAEEHFRDDLNFSEEDRIHDLFE